MSLNFLFISTGDDETDPNMDFPNSKVVNNHTPTSAGVPMLKKNSRRRYGSRSGGCGSRSSIESLDDEDEMATAESKTVSPSSNNNGESISPTEYLVWFSEPKSR